MGVFSRLAVPCPTLVDAYMSELVLEVPAAPEGHKVLVDVSEVRGDCP